MQKVHTQVADSTVGKARGVVVCTCVLSPLDVELRS